jgi:hypothetical protein
VLLNRMLQSAQTSASLRDSCVVMLQQAEQLLPPQVETAAALAYKCGCQCVDLTQAQVAFVIERICDELITGRVAVGMALPALCAAADVLASSLQRTGTIDAASKAGLAAAHFELDTLLPVFQPAAPPLSPQLIGAASLVRGQRSIAHAAFEQRRAARGNSPPARVRYD